jgi:hypothetical protein
MSEETPPYETLFKGSPVSATFDLSKFFDTLPHRPLGGSYEKALAAKTIEENQVDHNRTTCWSLANELNLPLAYATDRPKDAKEWTGWFELTDRDGAFLMLGKIPFKKVRNELARGTLVALSVEDKDRPIFIALRGPTP